MEFKMHQKFEEWLKEKHPEFFEEGIGDWAQSAKSFVAPALAASAIGGSQFSTNPQQAAAADFFGNRPTVSQSLNQNYDYQAIEQRASQDKDVLIKDNKLYIRQITPMPDNSPRSRLQAERVSEAKAQSKAVYILTGERSGFLPPGMQTVESKVQESGGSTQHYLVISVPIPR
jgi:hypothetical protein